MDDFWHFAKRMLQYRRLLTIGMSAAVIDALCAFGGIGALLWIVDQFFSKHQDMQKLIATKLDDPWVQWAVGDLSFLASYVPGAPFWGFVFVLGLIFVLAMIGASMRFTHQIAVVSAALRTCRTIRRQAFFRLVSTPMACVFSDNSADSLSRVVRDAASMSQGFTALLGKAVRNILIGSVALIWALIINWQLTLIFLIGGPIVYICIRKFGKRIRRATKYAMRAYGEMVGLIQESVQGLAVVKVHGAEGQARRHFNQVNRKVLRQELRARIAKAVSPPAIELVGIIGIMGVSVLAARLVLTPGGPEPSEMLKVLGFLGFSGTSLKPLANLNNNLQAASAAATRLRELIALPVEANGPEATGSVGEALPRHGATVRFEAVRYTYPGADRPAIDGINLAAEHGQTVAIVGANGSGKSTLLSLLPRLLEPETGRVLIDGYNIAEVSLRSLRQQMAMVTQQTVLFKGTISDNIAYGHPEASEAQIRAAAEAAMAHEFIAALPEGYEAYLGEGGSGLSGGQRQRLAIARAVLRDPAILILDEATSQIDAESEQRITEVLSRLRAGRTTFVIAHRLSTVIDADQIVVMENGGIIAQGTHAELLERSEVYRGLTHRQLQPTSA
jgi:ABC-type multidrug transport system fused ATPase/permease subunit